MRIVFAGTPEFAATALQSLIAEGHSIAGVYTQPDRPSGRGRKLNPSPVKQVALDAALPVFQPDTFKTPEARAELVALQPEVMVVAAYGLILPPAVLTIPTYGCLNIHASLLPRWRGAAPIQRAIAAGDRETGITIMQMDAGLDTGDMLYKITAPITEEDTGGSLHDRLAVMGGAAIVEALARFARGELTPQPQDDRQACYARKLSKTEGRINWSRPAIEIARQVRAFNPWPGSYTDLGDQRIRIHRAQALPNPLPANTLAGTVIARTRSGIDVTCGDGLLRIEQFQIPGGRPQSANDLINSGKEILMPGQELH